MPTNWLEKARAGCSRCQPDDSDVWPCPREDEHQCTAAKMAEAYADGATDRECTDVDITLGLINQGFNAALDAVLATTERDADGLAFAHGHIAISVKAVKALRRPQDG